MVCASVTQMKLIKLTPTTAIIHTHIRTHCVPRRQKKPSTNLSQHLQRTNCHCETQDPSVDLMFIIFVCVHPSVYYSDSLSSCEFMVWNQQQHFTKLVRIKSQNNWPGLWNSGTLFFGFGWGYERSNIFSNDPSLNRLDHCGHTSYSHRYNCATDSAHAHLTHNDVIHKKM